MVNVCYQLVTGLPDDASKEVSLQISFSGLLGSM